MTGGRHGLGVTSEATWKPRSQQGRKAHGVFLNTRSSVRPAHRGRQRRRSSEGAPLGSASICSPGRSLGPAQPRTRGHTRGRTTCNPTGQNRTRLQQNKRRGANPRLKPTRRTHPAGRSHLGLAGRWLRWSRVGGRAEHDCIELAVELGEPRVFVLDLLCFAPHPQGFFPQLLGFAPQLLDLVLELLRSQPRGVDLPLDVGIASPVERLQKQAPSRQR